MTQSTRPSLAERARRPRKPRAVRTVALLALLALLVLPGAGRGVVALLGDTAAAADPNGGPSLPIVYPPEVDPSRYYVPNVTTNGDQANGGGRVTSVEQALAGSRSLATLLTAGYDGTSPDPNGPAYDWTSVGGQPAVVVPRPTFQAPDPRAGQPMQGAWYLNRFPDGTYGLYFFVDDCAGGAPGCSAPVPTPTPVASATPAPTPTPPVPAPPPTGYTGVVFTTDVNFAFPRPTSQIGADPDPGLVNLETQFTYTTNAWTPATMVFSAGLVQGTLVSDPGNIGALPARYWSRPAGGIPDPRASSYAQTRINGYYFTSDAEWRVYPSRYADGKCVWSFGDGQGTYPCDQRIVPHTYGQTSVNPRGTPYYKMNVDDRFVFPFTMRYSYTVSWSYYYFTGAYEQNCSDNPGDPLAVPPVPASTTCSDDPSRPIWKWSDPLTSPDQAATAGGMVYLPDWASSLPYVDPVFGPAGYVYLLQTPFLYQVLQSLPNVSAPGGNGP